MIESCMTLGLLGVCSVEDAKLQEVGVYKICLVGIAGILLHLLRGTFGICNILGGISVGMALLILGRLFRGSIGCGDGLVLIDTGILLGTSRNLELLFTGLFLAGIWALILCVFLRKKRNDTFPCVPFLLISYVGMLICG